MGAKTKKRHDRRFRPTRGNTALYRNAKLIGGAAQVQANGQAVRPIDSMLSPHTTRHPSRH